MRARSAGRRQRVSLVARSLARPFSLPLSPASSPDNFGPKVPSSPFPYEKWAPSLFSLSLPPSDGAGWLPPLLFPFPPTFWPTFDRVHRHLLRARARVGGRRSTFIFFLTPTDRSFHCRPFAPSRSIAGGYEMNSRRAWRRLNDCGHLSLLFALSVSI